MHSESCSGNSATHNPSVTGRIDFHVLPCLLTPKTKDGKAGGLRVLTRQLLRESHLSMAYFFFLFPPRAAPSESCW